MAEPFIGEIRLFPYTYAPVGWAFCDGQLLPVSQNSMLFSLLHTTYGGNGTTNFALPDLRGRVPIHMGRGVGLSTRTIGQKLGVNRVTLDSDTLPQHTHNLACTTNTADQDSPVDAIPAQGQYAFYSSSLDYTMEMVPGMIDESGGDESHYNMMPFLTLHFCISLRGIYPPRS
jgi:microcystin-dependent protein